MRTGACERGFSLLEVMVAFAILAVSLGVLMQIFSRASLATHVAAQYSRAVSLAESRLEAVGSAFPLEEGTVSGEPEDGYAWELSIIPVDTAVVTGGEPSSGLDFQDPIQPYLIVVTAIWKDGDKVRRLSLSSLRLGEAE
jgi:general secretion pathway protein I